MNEQPKTELWNNGPIKSSMSFWESHVSIRPNEINF